MIETREDTAHAGPSRPRALVESALATAIDRYGPALFFDPDRLRQLLTEVTTEAPKEIKLLLEALSETVPQTLLAAHGNEVEALLPRLVKQVMKHANVERGPATWAVRTWAHALALPTTTIDSPARSMAAHPAAVNGGVDFASVITPRSQAPVIARTSPDPAAPPLPELVAPPHRRDGVVTPTAPPVPEPVPVPSFAPIPVAPVAIAARTPPDETPVDERVEALSDFVPIDEVVTVPAPMVEPVHVPEPVIATREVAHVRAEVPAPREPPIAVLETPAPIEVPIAPTAIETPRAASTRAQTPTWARTEPAEPRLPAWLSRPRDLAIVVLVLVVIGIGGIATMSRINTPQPAQTPTVETTPAPAEPAPRAPVADAPKIAATSPAPTVDESSTGTPTASAPSESASPASAPAETVTAAPTAATTRDRDLAGMLGSNASHALPEPTGGPTIMRIDPQAAVVGKAFSIALAVDGDPDRVAAIERRVLASDGNWPTDITTSTASALARTKGGAFVIPFRPLGGASTSTLQFTAVDRKGTRGPARTLTLRVVNPATKSSAAAVERAPTKASAPAPVAKKAESTTCTKTNCGTVVSMRELEPGSRATNYEIIVRMDDRKIHAFVQSNRWKPGTRVRMTGNRYVEIKG